MHAKRFCAIHNRKRLTKIAVNCPRSKFLMETAETNCRSVFSENFSDCSSQKMSFLTGVASKLPLGERLNETRD